MLRSTCSPHFFNSSSVQQYSGACCTAFTLRNHLLTLPQPPVAQAHRSPRPVHSAQAGGVRLSTLIVAFILMVFAAAALLVVRGVASGRFRGSASLSRIFGNRTAPAESVAKAPLSPSAAPVTLLLFWRTDGTAGGNWSSTFWSNPASATGGTGWASGADAQFSANSTLTFATNTIGNVTVDDGKAVTVTSAGTLTLAGVRTFNIGTGSTLTWTSQAQSTATGNEGAGIIKSGAGILSLGAIA